MIILVTAFRPFGGRNNNTSEDILNHLRRTQRNRHGIKLRFAILPVNFQTAWPTLKDAISKTMPDALLILGEKNSQKPAIETTAHNRRRHRNGDVAIEKSGQVKLQTAFAAKQLSIATQGKSTHAKPRWTINHDAGNYLCNFSYWKALAHRPELPCIFVHVPALASANSETKTLRFAEQTILLIDEIKKQVQRGFNTLSTQKQLTVPGQKAGRAKRKKGA